MAHGGIGKVIVAALTDEDAATYPLLDFRIYPESGVPQATDRERDEDGRVKTYAFYQILSNRDDTDMSGDADDATAEIALTIVSPSYAGVVDALNAAAEVLGADEMASEWEGIVVTGTDVDDVSDEPNGPIDSDDGQVFQGELTVSIAYAL